MSFDNTRKALAIFDAGKAAREVLFEAIDNGDDFRAWEAAEKTALEVVQRAFYEDTKDVNNLANCMIVGEGYMRKLVHGLH